MTTSESPNHRRVCKIFVEDSFDSAHWLPGVPLDHKCGRLHGHTYRIRIVIEGPVVEETGWVLDYADLKSIWKPVQARLDHNCLNHIEGLGNPTCEVIGFWILAALRKELPHDLKISIELRETECCGVIICE